MSKSFVCIIIFAIYGVLYTPVVAQNHPCDNSNCPDGQYCEDNNMCYPIPQPNGGGNGSNGGGNGSNSSSGDPFVPPPAPPALPDAQQAGPRIRNGGLLDQQTEVLPNVPWTGQGLGTTGAIEVGNRVMNTIRMTINRFLGFLALIALVLVIRAGFKILVGQDEDYAQAKTTLKNAFFGILMIGVSWLIVTFLFYVVCVVTEGEYCTSEQAGGINPGDQIPGGDDQWTGG